MNALRRNLDLERLVAEQLAGYIDRVPIGGTLAVKSSSELCDMLERLVPQVLRRTYPEWGKESIDGFFFSQAVKSSATSAELAGTCILISDQTVTPFALELTLSESGTLAAATMSVGEPGEGALGISGPGCNSRAAQELLFLLNERLARVEWQYVVSWTGRSREQ